MSKKDLFKGLLNDDIKDTGSSQKMRILNDHLLPSFDNTKEEDKKENEIDNSKSDTVQENTSVEPELPETDIPSENDREESYAATDDGKNESVSLASTSSESQDIPKPTEHDEIKAYSTSNNQSTEDKQAASAPGINNILSTLANTNDLNVEETHTRRTYLIENELLEELNRISKGKKRGFPTKVINSGLRIVLELMKENKHQI